MNTTLTPDQIESYRTDGCLVFPNLLSGAEIDELLRSISDALTAMGSAIVAGESNMNEAVRDDADSYYDGVFLQKVNLWKVSEGVKKVFLGPEMGKMVATLEGVEAMRIWHDQTLQKMAWGNPTAWHIDNPYWSFFSRHAISIWIALDDATVQNGCLYYIPGSHREARFEKNVGIGRDTGGLFKVYPEWSKTEPVVAEMKRGDCGFHNGLTAHGAGPNMTPRPRRAMTCGYMPDGSTYNGQKNILPSAYINTLREGDLLRNDKQNPLVYSKVSE